MCSFGVFAFLVLALGWVRVVCFALAALPCRLLGAHAPRVGGFGVCRVGRVAGAGQSCPAPAVWLRP